MNKIIISLLLLLASISFSQVNTTYKDGTDCNCDSIHQVYDDNGKLASEAPYVNGKLKRTTKLYFIDGTECECDSIITQRYEDNGLWETPYVNGKKNGVEKGYYDDGSIFLEIPYKNGKANGIGKVYYEDGSIEWETPYVNNKKNGIEYQYNPQGNLRSTAKYKNGVLDGYKHCSDGRMGNESLKCLGQPDPNLLPIK